MIARPGRKPGAQLQEEFAAAVDKLISDYAQRGMGLCEIVVELSDAVDILENGPRQQESPHPAGCECAECWENMESGSRI